MPQFEKQVTRRDAIRAGGVVFASGAAGAIAALLAGCGGGGSATADSGGSSSESAAACLESTNVTRGPYFVDEIDDPNIANDRVDPSIPERSDIRADSKGNTGVAAGLPLTLEVTVGSYGASGTCTPLRGRGAHLALQRPGGILGRSGGGQRGRDPPERRELPSRLPAHGGRRTRGLLDHLPGWYSGRAVHIHLKVRVFDAAGNITSEATTQLFFSDTISTAVYAANAADSIYSQESPALLVSLTGDASAGYVGSVSIGILEATALGRLGSRSV